MTVRLCFIQGLPGNVPTTLRSTPSIKEITIKSVVEVARSMVKGIDETATKVAVAAMQPAATAMSGNVKQPGRVDRGQVTYAGQGTVAVQETVNSGYPGQVAAPVIPVVNVMPIDGAAVAVKHAPGLPGNCWKCGGKGPLSKPLSHWQKWPTRGQRRGCGVPSRGIGKRVKVDCCRRKRRPSKGESTRDGWC